jgi:hypothetical protein
MRRKSYWSRSVGLLGGTAKFDVYTPDDIRMVAREILVRRRKADLTARLVATDGTWHAWLGALKPKQAYEGKHFATMRDLKRVRRAVEETWSTMWTPETAEQVFPAWFTEKWAELRVRIRTTFGKQHKVLVRQQKHLFTLLDEWRKE